MSQKRILFVCLGNICRSPMAEGMFIHLLKERGLKDKYLVDSAGTAGYHVGSPPDERMQETANEHGVHLPSVARKFTKKDFDNFDYIVVMDHSNMLDVLSLQPERTKSTVVKMRDFDTKDVGGNVPDPYYGGKDGFEEVFRILERCNTNFIDYLEDTDEI